MILGFIMLGETVVISLSKLLSFVYLYFFVLSCYFFANFHSSCYNHFYLIVLISVYMCSSVFICTYIVIICTLLFDQLFLLLISTYFYTLGTCFYSVILICTLCTHLHSDSCTYYFVLVFVLAWTHFYSFLFLWISFYSSTKVEINKSRGSKS